MLGVAGIIGVIYIIYKLTTEASERPWTDVDYSSMAYNHDFDKVVTKEMTWKEFERNVHAGKYRRK